MEIVKYILVRRCFSCHKSFMCQRDGGVTMKCSECTDDLCENPHVHVGMVSGLCEECDKRLMKTYL